MHGIGVAVKIDVSPQGTSCSVRLATWRAVGFSPGLSPRHMRAAIATVGPSMKFINDDFPCLVWHVAGNCGSWIHNASEPWQVGTFIVTFVVYDPLQSGLY